MFHHARQAVCAIALSGVGCKGPTRLTAATAGAPTTWWEYAYQPERSSLHCIVMLQPARRSCHQCGTGIRLLSLSCSLNSRAAACTLQCHICGCVPRRGSDTIHNHNQFQIDTVSNWTCCNRAARPGILLTDPLAASLAVGPTQTTVYIA